jgi:hypothetical protein
LPKIDVDSVLDELAAGESHLRAAEDLQASVRTVDVNALECHHRGLPACATRRATPCVPSMATFASSAFDPSPMYVSGLDPSRTDRFDSLTSDRSRTAMPNS